MTSTETQSILRLSVLAAFADGDKHERERDQIRRIAEGLSQADAVQLPTLYQDVLMKRVSMQDAAAGLQTQEGKQLAYEMAVCVCDADGAQSQAETAFLSKLRETLGLSGAAAEGFAAQAEAVAQAPIDAPLPSLSPTVVVPAVAGAGAAAAGAMAAAGDATSLAAAGASPRPTIDEAALDKRILDAAILNGAIELLPETLSTMAIIPLQTRLVYSIGKSYGYDLDAGHVKDFLATIGVGLTSQYLEQAGRKLLGGLLGKMGGGLLGGVGKQAVSSGMSFATTWALGQVARRYYAGGRSLSTQTLKDAFAGLTQEAQGLQSRYLPAMQEQARTLDAGRLLSMVRGGR